jgi:lysophospholipase L1-like esterase
MDRLAETAANAVKWGLLYTLVKGSVRRPLVRTIVAACALAGVTRCGGHSPIAATPTLAIFCPANVSVQPVIGASTVQVTFNDPTTTGGKPPVTSSCTARSGDSFTPGNYQINCSAVDVQAHTAACTFSVDVAPAPVPQLAVTKFLGFGDSETEGKISQSPFLLLPNSYTLKLASMLQARYTSQTIVVANDGQGGESAADPATLLRFDTALTREKPNVVLLMDGANDLESGDAGVDPAINALGTMAAHATGKGISVFLATIPPEKPSRSGAASVTSLNAKIVTLAVNRQLTLVDVYAAFNGDLSLIGADGLHPTDAGYQVVAQAFYDRIVAKFEQPLSLTR